MMQGKNFPNPWLTEKFSELRAEITNFVTGLKLNAAAEDVINTDAAEMMFNQKYFGGLFHK